MATEHPASLERATSVGSNRRHLAIVLGVALVTLGVDVVAAWLSGSLALIADAAHRVTDVIGISIAFGAATIAARPARRARHLHRVRGTRPHRHARDA